MTPIDPAAGALSPGAPRRVAQASGPGEAAAADSPRKAAAAGGMSPQPSGRLAAGMPDPGTGGADPEPGNRTPASPVRGRPQSPAGSTPLSGEEFRAVWQRERAARAKGQRGDQGRRARRVAAKAAGARFRPGMTRREPPGPPEDAA